MENNLLTIEAFAQFMRGSVTTFFLLWSFRIYRFSRRSRMMKWLFIATLYIFFSHLKDMVFIVNEWKNSSYINNVVNSIDLLFIPLISAFFLEACRPGFATPRRVGIAVALQAVFIPVYAFFPADAIRQAAYLLSLCMVVYTVVAVMFFTATYHRRLSENYSYRENIDVTWVSVSCIVYFSTLFIYICTFEDTTWLSEALYNVYSIVLWNVLFVLANRHRVMLSLFPKRTPFMAAVKPDAKTHGDNDTTAGDDGPLPEPVAEGEAAPADTAEAPGETELLSQQFREKMLKERLDRCMKQQKPYLDSRLTLGDLAMEVGTNKTYLSNYINNTLGTTFYELINTYRVEAACALIQSMSEDERIPMTEVAVKSGFNSIASFNRYFVKVKGITPKQFYFTVYDKGTTALPEEADPGNTAKDE